MILIKISQGPLAGYTQIEATNLDQNRTINIYVADIERTQAPFDLLAREVSEAYRLVCNKS